MKNQQAERKIPRRHNEAMPYDFRYPELHLTFNHSGAADDRGFNTPCGEGDEGYAQDTTAWD